MIDNTINDAKTIIGRGKKRYTHRMFVDMMRSINANIEFMSQYSRNDMKIGCRCLKCGYEWYAVPGNLLRGKGCPKCANTLHLTHDEFLERIKCNPHFSDIELMGLYKNSFERILCRCRVCGHEWLAWPSALLRGSGCRKCGNIMKSRLRTLSHERFVTAFMDKSKKFDLIEIIGTYKGGHEPLKCRCKVCGCTWTPLADNLLRGKGCPHCAHAQTSFAEQFLYWGLASKLGTDEVMSRDRKTIGKELDIVIPQWKLAIEYGSWFWHRKRIQNDIQKWNLCASKNIRLLLIFDGFEIFGGIPSRPPIEGCKMFVQDLGSENGHMGLKNLVCEILRSYHVDVSFADNEWNDVEKHAINGSRRMTDKDFLSALKRNSSFSSKIEVLGMFAGLESKILCRCRICGHKWSPQARNLLYGHSCPQCARWKSSENRRVKFDEFLQRFKKGNSRWNTISIIGTFKGLKYRLQCKCCVCGHSWMAYPANLIAGHACPKCGRQRCRHDM